jgi:hypothetical protein
VNRFCVVLATALWAATAAAQSIPELEAAYSGTAEWNADSATLTFTSSGVIDFKRDREMSGIWMVPREIESIVIAKDTRVTGQFFVPHDCRIEGRDQLTSVIHGTDTRELLHDKGLDGDDNCWKYSAVAAWGRIEVFVTNLTTLNPVAYMWTGREGARIHLDRVRGIDDRGGWHNHSDGIQAANGSTVRNCYLETGDDAIKLYHDILVENTTIKMIQNCVPIQLGWGDYPNHARGVFRNVTIIGDRGRGQPPVVIEGTKGRYRRTIEIDGLRVENPEAALVRLHEEGMQLDLTIANADIAVKEFSSDTRGTVRSTINGSQQQTNRYESK